MFEDKINEPSSGTSAQAQSEKRTYTVEEMQGILDISKSSAYALVKEGHFKSINVGRHIRISKKSFDEWLDSQA